MNILDVNKIKKANYIVIVPRYDTEFKNSIEYSLENVVWLDGNANESTASNIISYINDNLKTVIFFDWDEFYRLLLPYIKRKVNIKFIYKNNIATITDGNARNIFTSILEFYDRGIVKSIGVLDNATYTVLKHSGYRVNYIALDIKRAKNKNIKSNSIGILGNDFNPNHNVYNELSALKMIEYDYVKIIKCMHATEHFINFFDIKEKEVNNIDDVIKDNSVNLYCNFTDSNIELILRSFDLGVPCILGNIDIFDKYSKLKRFLVLESDDDVGEIASKINVAKDNREAIMKEYDKFRNDYSKASKESIKKFIND